MTMTYFKPIIYKDKTHRPYGSDEFIDPIVIPISALPGNSLRIQTDGLYVGASLGQDIFYVAAAGTDAPTSGSKLAPYKTLDYALAQLTAKSGPPYYLGVASIALKAGETFPMTAQFICGGVLQIGFYGDPNYGDFNGAPIGIGASPGVMADLQRPIITPALNPVSNGIFNIVMADAQASKLGFVGVQINLPGGAPGGGDYNDFVITVPGTSAAISMLGTICNITDTSCTYGFLGMHARSGMTTLYQFASEFQVLGDVVNSSTATTAKLLARQWFIKFYKDFPGNNQVNNTLAGSSPGSAVLQLNWSETASVPVIPGKVNLATWPLVADPAYGVGNYFYNLARDQQQRPLNVVTGILF